jgi:hypothetical protein
VRQPLLQTEYPQRDDLMSKEQTIVITLTNLADLQDGKRGKGDSVWLEARNRGLYRI